MSLYSSLLLFSPRTFSSANCLQNLSSNSLVIVTHKKRGIVAKRDMYIDREGEREIERDGEGEAGGGREERGREKILKITFSLMHMVQQ